MLPSNPLFQVNVSRLKHRLAVLLNMHKIKNLYFSEHFHERAVERNIDHREMDLFMMGLFAVADMNKTTYSTTNYKVSGKGIYLLAKIQVGTITNKRYIVVKTCYDSDVFDAKKFDVELKF
jgi:hypothetical protein